METAKISLPYSDDLDPIVSQVTFSRIPGNDTQIKVHNIISNNFELVYTLVDRYNTETNDGTRLRINSYQYDETGRWCFVPIRYQEGYTTAGYTTSSGPIYFDIKKNEFGVFEIQSSTPVYVKDIRESSNNKYHEFNNLAYLIAEPNCTFSHDRYKYNYDYYLRLNSSNPLINKRTESYPAVLMTNNDTNRFAIYNFNNWGFAQDANFGLRYITGTIDGDKFNFDADQIGKAEKLLTIDYYYYMYYWANLDFALRKAVCPDAQGLLTTTNDLTATFDAGEGLRHNKEVHGWVSNGGKRRTYTDNFVLSFDCDYTYHYLGYEDCGWPTTDHYSNVMANGDGDVTLDVELELSAVKWHGTDGVYMVGNIKTNKNDQYVDHYDVMIVKGKWDHIEQTHAVHGTFQPCPDFGHVNARVLCDHRGDATNGWGKQNVISLTSNEYQNEGAGEHDYEFAKLIRPEDLGAENLGADGKVENSEYTAFIRAIYKPETGLTPTFHDMKYLTVTTPTGVSDLAAEGMAPTVVAVPEGIAISGTDRTVQVVNTLGAVLYQGPATTVSAAPGMYIVRAGSFSTKVLVK